MACTKILSISEVSGDVFYPLNSAVYVPSVDKIIGTCQNYLIKHNATTGAVESAVKAISPMYEQMYLVLVNNLPWVSTNANRNDMAVASVQSLRDIYPVNATTLLLGPALGLSTWGYTMGFWPQGPTQMVSTGNLLLFLYFKGVGVSTAVMTVNIVDTTNTVLRVIDVSTATDAWVEQVATDGVNVYTPHPDLQRVRIKDMSLSNIDYSDVTPYFPVGAEWASNTSRVFATTGTSILIRVDDFPTSANTYFDLDLLGPSPLTPIKAVRLRYCDIALHPHVGKILIPVSNLGMVVIFDTVAGTAEYKTGFDSPIDVVFTTAGKSFAVQQGSVGLKEIS